MAEMQRHVATMIALVKLVTRAKKRHPEHNDYAVWDYVLKHSVLLLSKAELKALAQDFEQHLVSTSKTAGEPLNSDYLPYSTALYGLAAALNDCEFMRVNNSN